MGFGSTATRLSPSKRAANRVMTAGGKYQSSTTPKPVRNSTIATPVNGDEEKVFRAIDEDSKIIKDSAPPKRVALPSFSNGVLSAGNRSTKTPITKPRESTSPNKIARMGSPKGTLSKNKSSMVIETGQQMQLKPDVSQEQVKVPRKSMGAMASPHIRAAFGNRGSPPRASMMSPNSS